MKEDRIVVGRTDYLVECFENQKNNNSWIIVYVKSGNGVYSIGSSLKGLNQGDLLIIPPKVDYSFRSRELGDEYNINLRAVVLRFDLTWLDDILKVFPSMRGLILKVKELRNHYSVHGPKWMKLTSLFDELDSCELKDQPIKILSILSLISTEEDMVLVKNLDYLEESGSADRIEEIERYLSCNYCSKVTLQEVADYVGMSRTYFSIFFKRHFKEGFADYLNRKRVENAARMLLKTDLSIPVISSESGFTTVQYFTRAFKKVMGVPPGEYRRS